MKNRVDIKCEGDSEHLYVKPYINGEYLPHCASIIPDDTSNLTKIKFIQGEFPQINIENVETDLSQYVKIATIILRNELTKHGDLYNGFLASIKSALKNLDYEKRACGGLDISADEYTEISENILKFIIGEE